MMIARQAALSAQKRTAFSGLDALLAVLDVNPAGTDVDELQCWSARCGTGLGCNNGRTSGTVDVLTKDGGVVFLLHALGTPDILLLTLALEGTRQNRCLIAHMSIA